MMQITSFQAIAVLATASLVIFGAAVAWSQEGHKYPTFGKITRKDSRLDKLIPPGAQIEKLAEGFEWSEGPVWIADGKYILFSDIPNNAVMKWQEGDTRATVYLQPSGYTGETPFTGREPGSNGLLLDAEGRLILCQHGDRRIVRLEKDRSFTTLADKYDGKRLNSPNDAAFKSNGELYFTDPPYGLPKRGEDSPDVRPLDFCGVFRLRTDGTVELLEREMTRPNGIAFSPDEKILYVAQSDRQAPIWRAFDVQEDGTLANNRIFFDSTELAKAGGQGGPDGMTVDAAGNLFATGPGGVLILAPDGTHLGTIETGRRTANCTFGDDGRTLYMTADDVFCRVRTSTIGIGF